MAKRMSVMGTDTKNTVPTKMAHEGSVKPWWGVGHEITAKMSVNDVLVAAGADFEVATGPASYGPRKKYTTDRIKVLYRTDDGTPFDSVGSKYKPIQNRDVFSFFSDFIKAGDMKMKTAGIFDNGRRVWCLAEMTEQFKLGRIEPVLQYALFYQPHVYGESAEVMFTSVTPVCWNTMLMARRSAANKVRITHFRGYNAEVEREVKAKLGLAADQMKVFKKEANLLIETPLPREEAIRLSMEIIGDAKKPLALQSKPVFEVIDLFDGKMMGAALKTRKGTAWGYLNAVTEYVDHHKGWAKDENRASRLAFSWFGAGDTLKQRTLNALVEIAEAR